MKTHTNAFTHTRQRNSKQSWLMNCSNKIRSPSCDSKSLLIWTCLILIHTVGNWKWNCILQILECFYHCLWWKDAKIPCSASPDCTAHRHVHGKKITHYKTETLWGKRNNMVAVTKPSNGIYNDITGSLWLLFLLNLSI